MKALAITLCLFLAASGAWAATVIFNLTDFLTGTPGLTRKPFMVERTTSVSGDTTNVITGERRFWNTGSNGIVIASNMVAGIYKCSVLGNTWTSVFRINVVDTNGTLTASHIITSASSSAIDTEDGVPIDYE